MARLEQAGRRCRGQTLTEFAIMLAMMIGIVLSMVLFLAVFTDHAWRILRLVGLELP